MPREGLGQLSSEQEKDGERRRKSSDQIDSDSETQASDEAAPPVKKKRRPAGPEVGQALRSAYQRTLDEDIPPEMLDLLGRLG